MLHALCLRLMYRAGNSYLQVVCTDMQVVDLVTNGVMVNLLGLGSTLLGIQVRSGGGKALPATARYRCYRTSGVGCSGAMKPQKVCAP